MSAPQEPPVAAQNLHSALTATYRAASIVSEANCDPSPQPLEACQDTADGNAIANFQSAPLFLGLLDHKECSGFFARVFDHISSSKLTRS
jgi:hypothetical protein